MSNKNFIVGLFVSLALAMFIIATLWLSGKQGSEPTINYSMFFEKDVGGLMLGGQVFYLGVSVGSVTSMDIIAGNPMRVRVNAEVLKSAPINAGTYASLAFQGITGVAVVKLNADPGEHGILQIDPLSGQPIIPVRDVGFSAILNKAPDIVDKLDSVLVKINQILGEENQAFVSNVLEDIETISNALAVNEKSITEIPVLLEQTIKDLQATLVQITSMAVDLQPPLQSTIENLDQTTRNLAEMTDRLDTWTASNDVQMNGFMGDGLGQVPALISEARSTLREIKKLVKDLREDPSTLIYKPNEDTVKPEQ